MIEDAANAPVTNNAGSDGDLYVYEAVGDRGDRLYRLYGMVASCDQPPGCFRILCLEDQPVEGAPPPDFGEARRLHLDWCARIKV